MEILKENVTVVDNPIVAHNLSIIRKKDTNSEQFRLALKKISYALIMEAACHIPLREVSIETPIMKTTGKEFDNSCQLILAPILRAGIIFCEPAQELLPFANVHNLGMYRDENTLEAVWYYDKIKPILEDKSKVYVIILDPMLATGNSGQDAINNFIHKGVKEENIVFMSLLAAPEGIKKITSKFPRVKIVTSSIDECLNSKGYICPGLGDAGDRIFNTVE